MEIFDVYNDDCVKVCTKLTNYKLKPLFPWARDRARARARARAQARASARAVSDTIINK